MLIVKNKHEHQKIEGEICICPNYAMVGQIGQTIPVLILAGDEHADISDHTDYHHNIQMYLDATCDYNNSYEKIRLPQLSYFNSEDGYIYSTPLDYLDIANIYHCDVVFNKVGNWILGIRGSNIKPVEINICAEEIKDPSIIDIQNSFNNFYFN